MCVKVYIASLIRVAMNIDLFYPTTCLYKPDILAKPANPARLV